MMRKYMMILILYLICCNSYFKIYAGEFNNRKINSDLNLTNMTFEEFFKIISQETQMDFFTDESIKDETFDIHFTKGKDMTSLLDAICQVYHLKITKIKDVYIVTRDISKGEKHTIYGIIKSKGYDSTVDNVKITITDRIGQSFYSNYGGKYIISNIDAGVYILKFEKKGYIPKYELINLREKITTLNIKMERDNKIVVEGKKKDISKSSKLKLDSRFIVDRVKLNNFAAEDIKKILVENYCEKIKVSAIPEYSTVIFSGDEEIVENARALIEQLDSELKQVRISAQILDITNNLFESLGFNWVYTSNSSINSKNGVKFGILNTKGVAGIGQIYGSSIGVIRQFNNGQDILNLGINMLEANQDLVVSARPSILVVDGKEGVFKVTEEVIVGNRKHESNKNDRVNYTPIFKEAGIILKVKPKIRNNDEIILDTVIELSNFKLKKQKENPEDSGTFNSEGGSKVGRSISTTIKVNNGQMIFIGGLKKALIHNSDSKIPFLGTLPMLKFLFKNDQISHETSEIYIKLKVDIVENENCNFKFNELHQKINEIKNNKIF